MKNVRANKTTIMNKNFYVPKKNLKKKHILGTTT